MDITRFGRRRLTPQAYMVQGGRLAPQLRLPRKNSEASVVTQTPLPNSSPTTGLVVWFTGLSGAGKSTIASLVAQGLEAKGLVVEQLDGDIVRTHLSQGLGFSKADRDTNIERIGWVASRLARAGATVIVSAISPYAEARRRARALVEEHAPFVEVYVATALEECIRRDTKGLYAKALAHEIPTFTGITDPYEEPTDAELRLDTVGFRPEESADLVLARLAELDIA
jgi:adenylyl-sulfate kinase